jgi:hypothetical protein
MVAGALFGSRSGVRKAELQGERACVDSAEFGGANGGEFVGTLKQGQFTLVAGANFVSRPAGGPFSLLVT